MRPLAISDEMWMDVKNQFNSKEGLDIMDVVQDALSKDDLSESVMVLLNKLEHLKSKKKEKSETKSTEFRNKGNKAFAARKLQDALISYNQALLYAPPQSLVLKLAYSNRSAVFLEGNCAAACMKDIVTCFEMGCPDNIKAKLRKRRVLASEIFRKQKLLAALMQERRFSQQFFNFTPSSSQIACCSSDIEVIIENKVPKIIANKNIKPGTVLAMETAFVSETELDNMYYSCSYCHKMALNLMPCKGCTYALFCDAKCEKLALQDYHKIECAIGYLDIPKAYNKMIFKAALKIRSKCSSWDQFIEASNTMGQSRIKTSTVNEIFDDKEKFSLLNFPDNRQFVLGPRTSISILVALLIVNLKEVHFFPTDHLQMQAIQAFARVLMYLYLYLPKTQKLPSVSNIEGHTVLHRNTNFGVYSFISKIKNACPGNCITIDLNKKQALVAMFPIKAGTELSIPFCDPWITITPLEMYSFYNTVSGCKVCIEEKSPSRFEYTKSQEKALMHYMMIAMQTADVFNSSNVEEIFKVACGYMPLFTNISHTEEYRLVYGTFRKCLLHLQDTVSKNIALDLIS